MTAHRNTTNRSNGRDSTRAATPETPEVEVEPVTAPEVEDVVEDIGVEVEPETTPVEDVVETTPIGEPEVEVVVAVAVAPKDVLPQLVTVMDEYIKVMDTTLPLSNADGVRMQRLLQATIINAMCVDNDTHARANINYIMDMVHEYKETVFSYYAMFRFYDQVSWGSRDDRREMETILAALVEVSDPKTRGAKVKKLDWSGMPRFFEPRRADLLGRRMRSQFGIN